ncbi:hypothetical protein P8C59_004897 [Phyllachora maydis]|uniref:Zn(2)-C6 fungal-type domain-containing protein n=1 Tax=Phyllachora maydis TaxID=1825666 RepID=A0AAD9I3K7_9PEZI|nr:hypothetical protein P8C59_004897 [Phyllachora maydis]
MPLPGGPAALACPATARVASKRSSTGCENCREQHLKCDRVTPTCGRCLVAKRPCRRTGLKIRVTQTEYGVQQRWIKTPRRLEFVDETRSVIQEAQHPDGSGADLDEAECAWPMASSDGKTRAETADASKPRIYLDRPVWPLNKADEAGLFRHFVQELAIWLDLCDSQRSFETMVPRRAGTCPVLLNAILALAARHQSNKDSGFDELLANRYHQRCLRDLIPLLSHAATVKDENLFAATIILRVLEEMEVKTMGTDYKSYLSVTHAFVERASDSLVPGTLSAACFWVGLRQEIYKAMMGQTAVRMSLHHALADRSLADADDCTWANRAVVHCADVLNHCFGHQADRWAQRFQRWGELKRWNESWHERLPPSCLPIYCEEAEAEAGVEAGDGGPAFPEVWYHSSCHVIGMQHQLLAELFLTRVDPTVETAGSQATLSEEEESRMSLRTGWHHRLRELELVRRVCGIGVGNQWTPPGMFTACMAIAAFGDRFVERSDQEAMLDILKTTEKRHARPTEHVQELMKKSWGWIS